MDNLFGSNLIFKYSRERAIADGVLIPVGMAGSLSVVFTAALFSDYYADPQKITSLVNQGLELLRQPDPEDSDCMKLRVIGPETWIIYNTEEGITLLKPEDY